MVPVGGGGMVAGIAITVKVKKKKIASGELPTSDIENFILHHSTLRILGSTFPIAVPSHQPLALEMEASSLPHYPVLNL